MRLTDEEMQDVLARAEEIQRGLRHGDAIDAELEAVISAAQEVGIARPAVERALRERLNLPAKLPAAGSLAFAKSADGKFYVAHVLAASSDGVRVRFLKGTEHTVAPDEVRPLSFIPGERIVCHWPWWGPWTCTVMSYDAARKRVKVNDGWGYTRTFPIAEVWLPRSRAAEPGGNRMRVYATLLGTGAGIGALIGSLLTLLAR
jgi:hypothetical protein